MLNDQDKEGCSILHYASRLGCSTFIQMFLEQGAKISLKNNFKQSALHIAAKYGRKNSCLEFLKNGDFKLYVNEKDFEGNCQTLKEFHVLVTYFNICRFNSVTFSFTRQS